MTRLGVWASVLGLAAIVLAPSLSRADTTAPSRAAAPNAESEDVKLGRQNSVMLEKELKLVTDVAALERVNRVGQEIAAVANTEMVPVLYGLKEHKPFTYTFKVVEDKEVNAFSLPGGFIYVNTGLLNFVHSDDELAGVLAHEITHASHRHMMKLISQANKEQINSLLVMLGIGLSNAVAGNSGGSSGNNIGNLLIAAQLYTLARVNAWTIDAERDADQGGLRYLMKTRFSPVGMLTFMERLAGPEVIGPNRELGYLRNHPPSVERYRALLAQLTDLGIPIHRRDADPTLRVVVKPVTVDGVALTEVRLGDTVVARVSGADGHGASSRAGLIASSVNALLDQGLQPYEVRIAADGARVFARGRSVVAFTSADASAQKTTTGQLAQDTQKAIRMLIWKDQFSRVPTGSAGG